MLLKRDFRAERVFLATMGIIGLLMIIAAGNTALGAIYNEIGDAGQTLATAQSVNTLPGGTTLDAIRGTLEPGGADLFKIYLTGNKSFSATTSASSLVFNNFDTQLFLFNSSGIGVYANDNDPNSPPQSTLPAYIGLTPSVSGIYYLAISGAGYLPGGGGQSNDQGSIFADSDGLLVGGGTANVAGPTGPGSGLSLSKWLGTSSQTGLYEIQLTGSQFLPSGTVPEPGSIFLIGAGLIGIGLVRRKRTPLQSELADEWTRGSLIRVLRRIELGIADFSRVSHHMRRPN